MQIPLTGAMIAAAFAKVKEMDPWGNDPWWMDDWLAKRLPAIWEAMLEASDQKSAT